MTKSAEEIAEEYAREAWGDPDKYTQNYEDKEMTREDFLAGYLAASPKWVSVKDELPPLNIPVLLLSSLSKYPIVGERINLIDGTGKVIGVCFIDSEEHLTISEVAYWTTILEPPKEEK